MHDTIGEWVKERPVLLVIAAFLSVGGCCYAGQILARYSKTSNIELNKFYLKKRFEKQKTMQNSIISMIKKKNEEDRFQLMYGRHTQDMESAEDELMFSQGRNSYQ